MNKNNFNASYIGPRKDILKMVPKNVNRVLDFGCSTGSLGKEIKDVCKAKVYGVEIDKDMGEVAKKHLDGVLIKDIEKVEFSDSFFGEKFDLIIFGDVLEHLKDPWKILKDSAAVLSESGRIIASIPNVKHYSTFLNLVFKNEWAYKDRGIHDKTHLRFFTIKNIKNMFKDSGLKILKVKRKYRIIESPAVINVFSWIFALPVIRDFITHQYLIIAEKAE